MREVSNCQKSRLFRSAVLVSIPPPCLATEEGSDWPFPLPARVRAAESTFRREAHFLQVQQGLQEQCTGDTLFSPWAQSGHVSGRHGLPSFTFPFDRVSFTAVIGVSRVLGNFFSGGKSRHHHLQGQPEALWSISEDNFASKGHEALRLEILLHITSCLSQNI